MQPRPSGATVDVATSALAPASLIADYPPRAASQTARDPGTWWNRPSSPRTRLTSPGADGDERPLRAPHFFRALSPHRPLPTCPTNRRRPASRRGRERPQCFDASPEAILIGASHRPHSSTRPWCSTFPEAPSGDRRPCRRWRRSRPSSDPWPPSLDGDAPRGVTRQSRATAGADRTDRGPSRRWNQRSSPRTSGRFRR